MGVAGAAPPALLGRVKAIKRSDRGLVAELRKGPDIVLGSQARLRAKWAAAAAVLADSESQGAEYVDVRLPERPVAGGLPGAPTDRGAGGPGAEPDAATPQVAPQAGPQAAPQPQPQATPETQPQVESGPTLDSG